MPVRGALAAPEGVAVISQNPGPASGSCRPGSILVVDLEATCTDDGSITAEDMETIEIGAVWVDDRWQVIDKFQSFVRPVMNPVLTSFCIQLTGIRQDDVTDAPSFPEAVSRLREFVALNQAPGAVWASWGAWDCRQLDRESARHRIGQAIDLPHQNAKRLFAKAQRIGKEVGMAKACELAGLTREGGHHRGLDDALNVARLLPWVYGKTPFPSTVPD